MRPHQWVSCRQSWCHKRDVLERSAPKWQEKCLCAAGHCAEACTLPGFFPKKSSHRFWIWGFFMLGYFLDIVCFQTARISLLGGKSASKYQCKTFIICVWFQLSEKSTESSLSNMPHGSQCGDIPSSLLAVEEVDSPFMNILGPSQSCQGVWRTRIVVMR